MYLRDMKYIVLYLFLIVITSCKHCKDPDAVVSFYDEVGEENKTKVENKNETTQVDTLIALKKEIVALEFLSDTLFINLKLYSNDFVYDLKYATEDNFLNAKVYECAECYTRVKTAKALIKINKELIEKGYRIKFFDCYRPLDVQKKMWEIVPNSQYVAKPSKGSIHNRGGAVDITLVDKNGDELDMGTAFDYFGREAYHDYTKHSDTILANRKLLKQTMEKNGFWSTRTEWWHYNFSAASQDKVANFRWPCND